jgi:hypothetical protein
VSQERQQQLIQQQQQRLEQYRGRLDQRQRIAREQTAALQQQRRMAQYRFQEEYLEREREQESVFETTATMTMVTIHIFTPRRSIVTIGVRLYRNDARGENDSSSTKTVHCADRGRRSLYAGVRTSGLRLQTEKSMRLKAKCHSGESGQAWATRARGRSSKSG